MYRKFPNCSDETYFGLAIVDTCRSFGFPAGLVLSNKTSSRYVTVPHKGGLSRIRISSHKRHPEGNSSDLIEDVDCSKALPAALIRVCAAIKRLQPLDGVKVERLPDYFSGIEK